MSKRAPDAADRILHDVFGFGSFRPGQRDVIDRLLAGRHVLAIMPTGAGKSMCYQVPALIQTRPTIVVSPLVSLIDDQVAALKANGVRAACIHSGRHRDDNEADWRSVARGDTRILYMSPERLMTERMLAALEKLDPGLFVVDEAHCISKWGANFRPEYAALSSLKQRFPKATMAAFTATADVATQRDIARQLFDSDGDVIVQGFNRPNLWLGVTPKSDWKAQLLAFLESRKGQSGIVYCLSRRLTEEVTELLVKSGYPALAYHAGLGPEVRRENQETFMAKDGVVMVATIAFGMGIDKPDIRFVFHLNLPGSMEAYYQEIGRAGRDSAPADVFMVYGLDDVRMRRQFIENDGEDNDHKLREHKRLDSLLAYCEASQCRRAALLAYFGEQIEPCGNCDVCQNPPALVDGTKDAQMLFSAIVRTGQRFGTAHLIDIVTGKDSEKIKSFGHNELPTFGVGAAKAKPFWTALIRQAVAGGYITIDVERFGGLRLTERGRLVLNGAESFQYRETQGVARKKTAAARLQRQTEDLTSAESGLFVRLKELRRDLARSRRVPAYVIFSDQSLRQMCQAMPDTLTKMAEIHGVGPAKLKEFGKIFADAIRQHQRSEA